MDSGLASERDRLHFPANTTCPLPNPHHSVALALFPLRGGVYFTSLGSQLACDSSNSPVRQKRPRGWVLKGHKAFILFSETPTLSLWTAMKGIKLVCGPLAGKKPDYVGRPHIDGPAQNPSLPIIPAQIADEWMSLLVTLEPAAKLLPNQSLRSWQCYLNSSHRIREHN